MTNLEALKELIKKEDKIELLCWLENFAGWFDPGGWYSPNETIRYLNEKCAIDDWQRDNNISRLEDGD